jgi:serine/threonine protein kinase
MAPEQVKHKMVNERTDIYNFGATMYRLLTLRLPPPVMTEDGSPVDAKNWQRLFMPVKEANATAPPALCDLITACLDHNARQRPESMAQVQNILDKLTDELVDGPDDGLDAVEW